MSKLKTLRVAALASVCTLSLSAVAQAQDNGGFDISNNAATPAAPAAASAPASSLGEFSLGIGGVTESSAAFGRYNGMPESGVGFMGSWNLGTRDAWDSGTTRYYSFTGDNVNFGFGGGFAPEATITLKAGDQGTWSAFATYDAMTYRASNDFTTILDKEGDLSPGFFSALTALGTSGPFIGTSYTSSTPPSYFATVSNTAKHYPGYPGGLDIKSAGVGSTVGYILGPGISYPASPAALAPYNSAASPSNYSIYLGSLNELTYKVGTRRDKGTVGGTYDAGYWTLGAVVSHEHKEGSLEQAMTTAGSNAGFITFAMPIDYDADSYTVSANYDTDVLQAHFYYEFSNFIDHNSAGFAFEGWNFTVVKTGSSSPYTYASYESSGIYALPPSNQAHTISAEVAYNVDPATRVNGTVVYGLQLQNDRFVSPTLNQYTLANFGSYFDANPTSLDGLVQTWFANVAVNSRPAPELGFKVSYTLDARDAQTKAMGIFGDPTDAITPTAVNFNPAPNGLGCNASPCAVPWPRLAVPESWTKQGVVVEAEYHIDPSAKLAVGYSFKDEERSHAITHHMQDNTGYAKLYLSLEPGMTASFGYSHSSRSASAPDFSLWTQQIMSDCISNSNGVFVSGTLGCQQIPYYEAARTQDRLDGMFTDAIDQNTSLSLIAKYTNNNYDNPAANYKSNILPSVGVNRDYSVQAGPDLDVRCSEDMEVHAYYTFLRSYRDMRALNPQGSDLSVPGVYFYSVASTYDIHTAGIGGTWQASENLKLVGDYVFSYGSQIFAQSGSWGLGEGHQIIGGDPRLSTKSANNQVKLHAVYDYKPGVSLYLGYQFDSLDERDWALVGRSLGQVLTGDIPPKYNVSTITAGVTVKM